METRARSPVSCRPSPTPEPTYVQLVVDPITQDTIEWLGDVLAEFRT